jgi:hypothetical protein
MRLETGTTVVVSTGLRLESSLRLQILRMPLLSRVLPESGSAAARATARDDSGGGPAGHHRTAMRTSEAHAWSDEGVSFRVTRETGAGTLLSVARTGKRPHLRRAPGRPAVE